MVREENRLPHPETDAPEVTIENRIWGVKRQRRLRRAGVVSGPAGLSPGRSARAPENRCSPQGCHTILRMIRQAVDKVMDS